MESWQRGGNFLPRLIIKSMTEDVSWPGLVAILHDHDLWPVPADLLPTLLQSGDLVPQVCKGGIGLLPRRRHGLLLILCPLGFRGAERGEQRRIGRDKPRTGGLRQAEPEMAEIVALVI